LAGGDLRSLADEELSSRSAENQRQASVSLGRSLIRAVTAVADERERADLARIEAALGHLTPRATVFGAAASTLGVSETQAVEGYLYVALSGMIAAAVRLRLIAPLEGQAVLRRVLRARDPEDRGSEWAFFAPLLDIAAMWQETLEPRLFAS
jgi:urease accessory protein UreF